MDNIFGLSMNYIMIVTLAIMGLCLLTVALIAWRNRVIFRMAVRNIPRRKAQTILIMVGLMLSTLIIAASLTTGDTIDYSITKSTYDGLGQTDETIAFVGPSETEGEVSTNNVPIPVTIVDSLEQQLGDDPDIQGFMPLLTIDVPAVNMEARLSEPSVVMTGVDFSRIEGFGGFTDVDGNSIGDIPAGSGVISESLAEETDTQVGDTLAFFFENQPQQITVSGIASDSILTGLKPTGESADQMGIAVSLGWLQELTGLEGMARFIAVSNTGDVEHGDELTDQVMPKLKDALVNVEGGDQLGVNPIKQDAVEGAATFGAVFMSFFIVLGLFSIAAGILLIFLIFMMLAAERRSEMGMARAVGMKRDHLVQGFIAEGAGYDLGAALIGAALGVLVAFAIAGIMSSLIGEFVDITPHASFRSLVVAYSLGVTVTFITILFASVRSSRLNIVAAIRDLPDAQRQERGSRPRWRWWHKLPRIGGSLIAIVWFPFEAIWNVLFIWLKLIIWVVRLIAHFIGWGVVLTVVGVLSMLLGTSSQSAFFFFMGLSLGILGIGLFLRRYIPDRIAYTVTSAIVLLIWLSPEDWTDPIFPTLSGDIEMFFLSGIMMVTFATLIIMWNADIIVSAISVLGKLSSRWLPAIKTAVAYPLAARGRTGMTLAMFSLVIFSLVTLTTINKNFSKLFSSDEATAGWDIAVLTNPSNPIPNLREALAASPNNEVDVDNIAAVGRIGSISYANTQIREPGEEDWGLYGINGLNDEYLENAELLFEARAPGYADDQAVVEALKNDPNVAVIDSFAFGGGGFGSDPDAFDLGSYEVEDNAIPAIPVELLNPRTGETSTVTIIAVIDSKLSTLFGMYMNGDAFTELYGTPDFESLSVKLNDTTATPPGEVAKQIESSLLETGAQAESIEDQIEENLEIQNGFLNLLQGFMALGLLVGIAALGVISFRSVVERRQQIGMLRAIGYRRNMVAASFLMESLVIAALGILSGTVMAIILSYNLINSDDFQEGADFTGFVVPWGTILLFVVASLVAAALMTWVPARKASSVPIAEALRYE